MNATWTFVGDLLAIVCSSLLVLRFPSLKRPQILTVLGVATTAFVYGFRLPGVLLWSGLCFLAVHVLHRARVRAEFRWRGSVVAIGILVVAFSALRFAGSHNQLSISGALNLLPDMWLLLRLVCFLWEYGSGKIEPGAITYLRWMTLPFTLQGPLLRYSEFASQTEQVEEHLPAFNFKLLGLGTVQIALGLSSYPLTELLLRQHALWASLLVGLGTAPWGFYFAAAGVFHLMEALAQPWGITLPKSFDRPFGRSNLSAFWSSWNLTVTNFFRDALFYQRWGLRKPSVYLNLLLLFIAVGLWHGSNFYWICWGALHGLGFIIYVLHRSGKIRIFKAVDNKASRFANVALTYLFVCGCWYIPNKLVILATPLALLLRH